MHCATPRAGTDGRNAGRPLSFQPALEERTCLVGNWGTAPAGRRRLQPGAAACLGRRQAEGSRAP
eukprot:237529-Alexandrium_andersonii.AAC.1